MISWRVYSTRWIFICIVSPILGLLLIYHLLENETRTHFPFALPVPGSATSPHTQLGAADTTSCHYHPELEHVLVILKTGVTEALDKIPMHIGTTLRCIPHYAVFSDYEEDIPAAGSSGLTHQVVRSIDVLRNVSEEVKQSNLDFDLYNRVHERGRAGLQATDTANDKNNVNSAFGKPDNPGWKLDKWKFLPMIDEALRIRPEAKWYVFMEADTYIIWQNLGQWLGRLDASKPFYLGSQMQIGNVIFAYGGSGIVLSNPAMKKVSQHRAQRMEELEDYTRGHWAGDCVLGKALADADVPLTWAWPMMQTSRVWEIDPFTDGYGRRPWCHPVVSFHHMNADDIKTMWRFEQDWFQQNKFTPILHENIFQNLTNNFLSLVSSSSALPYAKKEDWDNFSQNSRLMSTSPTPTFTDCAQKCAENKDCLQFSYEGGNCSIANSVLRGVDRSGIESGWMMDRIQPLVESMGHCKEDKYMP
ncbi:hypothetical protein MPDQ_001230 [Monascus purpureus]|uniref:Apple domain-containing protein n=1 Tax=Monascus purpureus TaxID=5098 RepID=A0A507QS23_MONPU|nr:hypothetical protein MPDQ_001230 [Monascus purpureus]BDD59102.1 hypothetical protein MAP00_004340 [Monascus purpureus]